MATWFGVLGREACAALGAVGGCDGDGAPRREARGLGAVSRDVQHLYGPGGGWRTQALFFCVCSLLNKPNNQQHL